MSRKGFDLVQTHIRRVYGNEAFARTSYEVFAHGPSIYRAALTGKPYPVRAMITLSSNPMVTVPNTRLVYQALKSLDLYVVADFFMTPAASWPTTCSRPPLILNDPGCGPIQGLLEASAPCRKPWRAIRQTG